MRLVVQKAARATVEVDGYVESRIGSGLVLSVAMKRGDTREQTARLAAQVLKQKLWPDMLAPEKLWGSNVVDNGFEVLVLYQPTLCANLAQHVPSQQSVLGDVEAKVLFEEFVAQLRKEYQEEMVVAAPFDTEKMRVEVTQDGSGMFAMDGGTPAVAPASSSKQGKQTNLKEQTAPAEEKSKRKFSAIKQEQHDEADQAESEVPTPRKRPDWTGRAAPNTPADGRTQARYGSQSFLPSSQQPLRVGVGYKGGKKGKGKGVRSYGIASLDESARLHGSYGGYDYGQLSALPDAKMTVGARQVKEELDEEAKRRAPAAGGVLKRPKGTPTVAPLCPAQAEEDDEVWEDL